MSELTQITIPVKDLSTSVITPVTFDLGGGGSGNVEVKTQTMESTDTTVTFTGIPTTGDYMIDFYTSNGANYTAIDTSVNGQITLTYAAPGSTITVYCRIEEVV